MRALFVWRHGFSEYRDIGDHAYPRYYVPFKKPIDEQLLLREDAAPVEFYRKVVFARRRAADGGVWFEETDE